MNLGELQDELERIFGYTTAPPAAVTDRFNDFLNQIHRRLLSHPDLAHYRQERGLTVASTASTAFVSIPYVIDRILAMYEGTNNMYLREVSIDDIRLWDPGDDQSGVPWAYAFLSKGAGVAVQPSDASAVIVDSTAAGDTGSCFIEGIRSGGYYEAETITMNGTTGVSSARTDYIAITKFYLSAAAAGTVTLREDTEGTGTLLATINIDQTYARYSVLRLFPTPSSAITYSLDILRRLEDMANANDEPLIPPDFHDLLVFGAAWREHMHRQQRDLARDYEAMYQERFGDLIYWAHASAPQTTIGRQREFSHLGPFFPPGT